MTSDTPVGNKLNGFFRGLVVKHLAHGKCKVWIPAIYSEEWLIQPDLLPDAEQATPLFAGSNHGNGMFSYPNIGAMVWCFFANGDQNYPIIFAATLGGENAFNQYNDVKTIYETNDSGMSCDVSSSEDISLSVLYNPDDPDPARDLSSDDYNRHIIPEAICKRHMITSGNSHIVLHENGLICACVSTPYDNDAVVDTYASSITCDVSKLIADETMMHKNCQFIMTDMTDYGSTSAMIDYYNPIVDNNYEYLSDDLITIVSTLTDETRESKNLLMNSDGSEQLNSTYDFDYKKTYSKREEKESKITSIYDKRNVTLALNFYLTYGGDTFLYNTHNILSTYDETVLVNEEPVKIITDNYHYELSNMIVMSSDSSIKLKTELVKAGILDKITNDQFVSFKTNTEKNYKSGCVNETIKLNGIVLKKGSLQYSYDNAIETTKNVDDGSSYTLLIKSIQSKNKTPLYNAIYKQNMSIVDGLIEISLVDNILKHKCIITLDKKGVMNIETTNELNIKTKNNVNVKTLRTTITSPKITLIGNTTVKGTMHITGATTIDSSAKIAADANIGGKSFLGHMHIGNHGSPTSPPI